MSTFKGTDIEVMGAVEAIRRRPGMYVAGLDRTSLPAELAVEALCHAADAAVDGRCTQAQLWIQAKVQAQVKYDAGLPHERSGGIPSAHAMLTELFACRNAKKHVKVGTEVCRHGLVVLNALSRWLHVSTTTSHRTLELHYQCGVLAEPPQVRASHSADSTEISFELDTTILGAASEIDLGQVQAELVRVSAGLTALGHPGVLELRVYAGQQRVAADGPGGSAPGDRR